MKKKAIKIILTIMIIVLVSFIINTTYSKYYFSNSINGSIITVNKYVRDYSYTGNYQTFLVPYDGVYRIELWGANGGIDPTSPTAYRGSGGAYTAGDISLKKGQRLYFYIGGQPSSNSYDGGWNGGGKADSRRPNFRGYGGGGATDVRILDGAWDDFDGLKTRIMVAAGGVGGYITNPGGGLYGLGNDGSDINYIHLGGRPSQTEGGKPGDTTTYPLSVCQGGEPKGKGSPGSFGKGGDGGLASSGAGSGYFGGGGGYRACHNNGGGISGSGSSYISGHTGCVAVSQYSTVNNVFPIYSGCTTGTTNNSCSINYSKVYFTNTLMISGDGYEWTNVKGGKRAIPSRDGSNNPGNLSSGYARVTQVY